MTCCRVDGLDPTVFAPCALHLAEGDADYSTLCAPPHVETCVPNFATQKTVGAFGRAVLEAWEEQ